ncbi:MAG: RDD family protein [Weeksellaceae bacterium]|nr:RDD family protein [Weeksellaceae bacterium]
MNKIQVNTSQNVNLDFTIASIGTRMLAFIIDLVIKAAYVIAVMYIVFSVLDLWDVLEDMDVWLMSAFFIIIFLPIEFYTLLFENYMEGQTPGKRIMRIKVIKIDGYQARFSDYLTRWVFRVPEIWLTSGFVGLIAIFTSKYNQRLGGIASGTVVISTERNIRFSHTLLQEVAETYQATYPQVVAITDRDMQTIKTHYQQALARKDYQIIQHLAAKVRQIMGLTPQQVEHTDIEFLKTIIQDFNHLTKSRDTF